MTSKCDNKIVRPIVYGNTARYFSQKRESDGHTHEWTLYVKPYYDEDPSRWIRRVTFKLHESIPNHTRTIDRPPYTITETGWGEFEASIKLHFVDGSEKPVTAYHFIRLFNTDPRVMCGEVPLVNEYYDEVVFQEPTPAMRTALIPPGGLQRLQPAQHSIDFTAQNERTLTIVDDAHATIKSEIDASRTALKEMAELLVKQGEKYDDMVEQQLKEEAETTTAS